MTLSGLSLLLLSASMVFASTAADTVPLRGNRSSSTKGSADQSASDSRFLIVNGESATIGEFPFYVWLDGCGGSLIHEDIVLTAAHCAPPDNPFITAVVGAFRTEAVDGGIARNVERSVGHPLYNSANRDYDVMVAKLDKPVTSKTLVALNRSPTTPAVGGDVTVIGLGLTNPNDDTSYPDNLQKVTVLAQSHQQCEDSYGSLIEETWLCAGLTEGGKDSCHEDSGGPLFEVNDGSPLQVGIVSYGQGCAEPNFAGMYARVSGVVDWIDEQICEMSSNPPASCSNQDVPDTPAPVVPQTTAPAVPQTVAPVVPDTPAPVTRMPTTPQPVEDDSNNAFMDKKTTESVLAGLRNNP